ncbi:MAG: hypothetical protein S4CHLAM7_05740 [Chlamydiae bacterium]|nr:hypothetical protein [Chlamydiota bacterium]
MTSLVSGLSNLVYKNVNEGIQYAKENPYKTLGYTLLTVGALAGSVAFANKALESTISTCSSYENYHSACDLVGFARPDRPLNIQDCLDPIKAVFSQALPYLQETANGLVEGTTSLYHTLSESKVPAAVFEVISTKYVGGSIILYACGLFPKPVAYSALLAGTAHYIAMSTINNAWNVILS